MQNKTKKRHVVSFFIVPLTRFTYIGAKIAYQQVYSAVNRQMRFSNHVVLKRFMHTPGIGDVSSTLFWNRTGGLCKHFDILFGTDSFILAWSP
jgi:hypothetical protein